MEKKPHESVLTQDISKNSPSIFASFLDLVIFILVLISLVLPDPIGKYLRFDTQNKNEPTKK